MGVMPESRTGQGGCLTCGILVGKRRKFCCGGHGAQYKRQRHLKANPLLSADTSTTGAIGELQVAVDLLRLGYQVFRAMSPSCPCDLVVMKNGKAVRVEVKTLPVSPTKPAPSSEQLAARMVDKARKKGDGFDLFAGITRDGKTIIYQPALKEVIGS